MRNEENQKNSNLFIDSKDRKIVFDKELYYKNILKEKTVDSDDEYLKLNLPPLKKNNLNPVLNLDDSN